MIRYIAFLRGVNVGGNNVIKMLTLQKNFEAMGFKNVRTVIQSGNVVFDSPSKSTEAITKKIEKALLDEYESNIKTMVRTFAEVENIVKLNPFKKIKPDKKIKIYVCFLSEEPNVKPKLPLVSEKKALEAFEIKKSDVFLISREIKNGRFGFPANFLEKELNVWATARQWNTIRRIIDQSI